MNAEFELNGFLNKEIIFNGKTVEKNLSYLSLTPGKHTIEMIQN